MLPVSCEGQTKARSSNARSRRSSSAGESSGRGMSLGHFYPDMFDVSGAFPTIKISASNINKLNDFVHLPSSWAQREKRTGFAHDFSVSCKFNQTVKFVHQHISSVNSSGNLNWLPPVCQKTQRHCSPGINLNRCTLTMFSLKCSSESQPLVFWINHRSNEMYQKSLRGKR